MRNVPSVGGSSGRPSRAPCSWRVTASSSSTSHACVPQRRRDLRAQAATVEAPEIVPEPVDETPCYAPSALQLETGELSEVVRSPPEASDETFRCIGCTDAACQGPSGCNKTVWRYDEAGYLRAILTSRVYDVAKETPLDRAELLSKSTGNSIWLKREDLQPVFSFKLRGAYNKMASLPKSALEKGVVCSSAGNHAQGVALAAQRLSTTSVICMPINTPTIKVSAVKALGGEVRLVGESYTETQAYAWEVAEQDGRTFIAPYDDPYTIAGQGTIGAEVLKQLGHSVEDLDAVFVPIGGGGLIAGIAVYIKALKPNVKIIGVEPTGANCMAQSLQAGRRVTLSRVDAFADGVAVKSVGVETFRLCQRYCDGVVLVDNAAISAAIKDVFTESRTILEPAGALGVAGAKAYLARNGMQGATVVALTSGANMNFDRLRLVADLANYGQRTEAMLTLSLPERSGEFRRFVESLYDGGEDEIVVTECKYRYSVDRPAKMLISLAARSPEEVAAAVERLREEGYVCRDVTQVTAAQVHLRHMVGGRPRSYTGSIDHEKMVVVTFPEKVGALRRFLQTMAPDFNVTMFHYRSTGNRTSSVLLGIQVPTDHEGAYAALQDALLPLDYTFEDLDTDTQSLFDEFIS
eukprot:jgi/Ulvmu1/9288/UM050_0037.1